MKQLIIRSLAAISLLCAAAVHADESAVRERLQTRMPNLAIDSVTASPISGVYEVVFDGYRVVYISEDGNYVLDGNLMALESGENLTRSRSDELQQAWYREQGKAWLSALRGFGDERLLRYKGDSAAALNGRQMYVFTDVTCPYCGRFHQQVPALNAAGVTVNYILFARAGLGSGVHQQHIDVWCADDPQGALSRAKAGQGVKSADESCEHPIDDHMALVQQVSVNATPTIVLDSGERVDGFRPAADFISLFDAAPALP